MSSIEVRVKVNDLLGISSYHPNVPRKKDPVTGPPSNDWFLPQWMRTLKVTQAVLADRAGWSKATMNDIYHGRTSYYRQILNEAAAALHLQPWELLMHPQDAMTIRQLTRSIRGIEVSPRLNAVADEDDLPMVASLGR